MSWLDGPLKSTDLIFGIHTFWIIRIAKILQFFSASVIAIEIVGKNRVEEAAIWIAVRRESLWRLHPVRRFVDRFNALMGKMDRGGLFGPDPRPTKALPDYLRKLILWTSVIVGLVFGAKFVFDVSSSWSWDLVWRVPIAFGLMFGAAFIAVWGLALMPILAAGFIPRRRRDSPWYEYLLQIIAFAIAIAILVFTVRSAFWQSFEHWKWEQIPFLVLFAAYILFASYLTGFLVVYLFLFGPAIVIWCILLPVSWLADHFARALVRAMRRAGAVRFVFIVALCVLVGGFVLDLSTS